MQRFIVISVFILGLYLPLKTFGADYNASLFGIKSNGSTLNTKAIQKAIDYIHEQGGGRLVFYVGRYLTGSIELKSNVSIKLYEGAVLVGAPSIYEYMAKGKLQALIRAEGQQNIGISGKGVIEGNGWTLLSSLAEQEDNGYLDKKQLATPGLLDFNDCTGVQIDSVNLWKAAGNALIYSRCNRVQISDIAVISKVSQQSGGVLFAGCRDVKLINAYIETTGIPFSDGGNNEGMQVLHATDKDGLPVFNPDQRQQGPK